MRASHRVSTTSAAAEGSDAAILLKAIHACRKGPSYVHRPVDCYAPLSSAELGAIGRHQDAARTALCLRPMLLSFAWSSSALLAAMAVGLALEEAASRQLFFLHLFPIGPSPSAADVNLNEAVPRPFGEHGWIPFPLALLGLGLVLLSDRPGDLWQDASWWATCRGPLWGLLPAAAVCTFTILPALLAAWLLWMPWHCSPLPVALAASVFLLAGASLLFWSDRLPLLPRALAHAEGAQRGVRRALLQLLHPVVFAAGTRFFWAHHGERQPLSCAELLDGVGRRPADFGAALAEELQALHCRRTAAALLPHYWHTVGGRSRRSCRHCCRATAALLPHVSTPGTRHCCRTVVRPARHHLLHAPPPSSCSLASRGVCVAGADAAGAADAGAVGSAGRAGHSK